MNLSFANERSKILVALKFDDSSKRLLKSVHSLSQTTNMSVKAVHFVHDVLPSGNYYPDYFGTYDVTQWVQEENARELADAETELQKLMNSEAFECKWQAKAILSKDSNTGILAESHDASLLVLAVEEHRYQMIPRSFSMVLSALASSNVPVLVIRDGGPFDFSQKFRLLIADDLSPSSIQAVRSGIAFGLATNAGDILHAHFLPPHIRRFESQI